MDSLLKTKISEINLVAFDTETSGSYPVKDDIVEFGAVKWKNGKEIDRIEFLFKPKVKMSDFIIGIHGISNEMVADKPSISQNIHEIRDFFKDSVGIAHHAPFDLGFISYVFEKNNIAFPKEPVLCTSLLSRKLILGVENHKLQTLIKHFGFPSLAAHRAYEDARACMFVFNECIKSLSTQKTGVTSSDLTCSDITLSELIKFQGKSLLWQNYSLSLSSSKEINVLVKAIEESKQVQLVYAKGNKKNQIRSLQPLGIVRNPDGDYLQAFDPTENKAKRFLLEFIKDVVSIH